MNKDPPPYVRFLIGFVGDTCECASPVLNYPGPSLSKPTSGIGPGNWMVCCFNFGCFVYNPIIETVKDHREGGQSSDMEVETVILTTTTKKKKEPCGDIDV